MDTSSALFTTGGETIVQAASIPIHLGSLVPMMPCILYEFPTQTMAEGNIYIKERPLR
jgi:N-methylhydantoinase B